MYFMANYYMLTVARARKNAKVYITYGTVILILLTIDISTNAIFGQLMWIEHRDVPGGPAAYMGENLTLWVNTLGTASGVAVNFMGDALLLYRCFFIWSSDWRVVALPFLIFVGSFSMAIISVYESGQPGASFFAGKSVDFGVPYTSLTISFNIIVTLLICGRLLGYRNQMRALLGAEHARTYTSLAAMVVESAAPFTILGIAYVVSYARNSPTSIGFVQIWGKFCAISPQLIILRVAMGKAWSKDTVDQLTNTNIQFSENNKPGESTGSTAVGNGRPYIGSRDAPSGSSLEKWRKGPSELDSDTPLEIA
ncbi:hypothetical protein PLICRDRAFT_26010 [Plicaturopsis crispa FD-325 SS-3]|nr:hypothetical protein PLICRDRAFT_26010 [Plicaturopsis crispa FD-325 SS-3]